MLIMISLQDVNILMCSLIQVSYLICIILRYEVSQKELEIMYKEKWRKTIETDTFTSCNSLTFYLV